MRVYSRPASVKQNTFFILNPRGFQLLQRRSNVPWCGINYIFDYKTRIYKRCMGEIRGTFNGKQTKAYDKCDLYYELQNPEIVDQVPQYTINDRARCLVKTVEWFYAQIKR